MSMIITKTVVKGKAGKELRERERGEAFGQCLVHHLISLITLSSVPVTAWLTFEGKFDFLRVIIVSSFVVGCLSTPRCHTYHRC